MKLLYGIFHIIFFCNNFVLYCECVLSHKDQELIIAAITDNASAIPRLIATGANISASDNHGMTAIHWAAEYGHHEAAKVLIDRGARIDAQDFFFNTPLHIACSHKNGADFTAVNLAKHTPISLSTIKDEFKPILIKMRKKGRDFIDAVKKGNIELAQQFIDQRVNINIRYTGISPISEALRSDKRELVEWLIKKGVKEYKFPFGQSLREKAAAKGIEVPDGIETDRALVLREAEKKIHEWLQENPPQKEIEKLQKQNGHALTWKAYHRLEDIYSFLKYLTEKHGSLCKLSTIGTTHEGRPLKVLRISNGNPMNKAIWIDGGIHAREWISPAAVTYIANDLVRNWNKQPDHIQNLNWHILAVHNPDGYEFSHQNGNRFWRKNRNPNECSGCAGVDLNRNYDGHKWGGEKDPCEEDYCGKKAFSEPESEAVRRFFNTTKEDFYAFLTFHSFGQYILYPTDENMSLAHFESLCSIGQEAVQHMKAINNQTYTMGCDFSQIAVSGSSEEWAASIGIKYSYTIELRDRGRYGFLLPASQIEPTAKEAQAFVRTISKAIFEDVQLNELKKDYSE
ncbi:carboxypeptidase B-like isoform X2 [Contarinia nasturtii]|uniref:carboxypeptidase B-like isoform X2 n=1 Tax=Contarinia nasturtii TaxID=265458 RepID=UPI0012D3FCF7|nr:carboxypeptidase B-like isoform X2 [Contarinia nasturtii]